VIGGEKTHAEIRISYWHKSPFNLLLSDGNIAAPISRLKGAPRMPKCGRCNSLKFYAGGKWGIAVSILSKLVSAAEESLPPGNVRTQAGMKAEE
jgi:hypothetical protein